MKRVVVTGFGVVSPIGNNSEEFCTSLKNGTIGFDKITKFTDENISVSIAAEVKNFDPEKHIPKKEQKRLDLFSQYAIVAAKEAVEMSGLESFEGLNRRRFGVMLGSGIGGFHTMETDIMKFGESDKGKIAPLFIPMSICNMAAGNVAIALEAKGICTCVVTACASGTHSVGEAFRNIKHGYSDVIVAGGTEAAIVRSGVQGFNVLKTLSSSTDKTRASIPFDSERDGFVIGEGSGLLVLEEYEHAKRRNAPIYAEIVGYGANCDAYHMTAPDPEGSGARDAMIDAIEEAGITRDKIGYVNAHGTSTPLNDPSETKAIKAVFGENYRDVYVSSTKSMTGHLLGAAGGIEAVAVVLALKEGFLPPNVGLKHQDPECDLTLVLGKGMDKQVDYALSNSLGFGGHNAVVCFKRWDE